MQQTTYCADTSAGLAKQASACAVSIEADSERVDKLLSELEGKSIEEVISAGVSKLASVPAGGGGGGGGGAAGGGGGGAAGQFHRFQHGCCCMSVQLCANVSQFLAVLGMHKDSTSTS